MGHGMHLFYLISYINVFHLCNKLAVELEIEKSNKKNCPCIKLVVFLFIDCT